MASNSFGTIFKITTWGESHGRALGVVIDGCPAGLEITEEEIFLELQRRRPGHRPHTSPRKERDLPEILSGVFEGRTTGAPLSIVIFNEDAHSASYEPLKELLRPGHANFTYLEKYGIFDYRGGGRASARETVSRVMAGAVAKKLLRQEGIELLAYMKEVGGIEIPAKGDFDTLKKRVEKSLFFCPDTEAEKEITSILEKCEDSYGGIVELITTSLPVGLGDPVYEKLEANLGKALLTIPATKGVEFGAGFKAARMRGSEHNDLFLVEEGKVVTQTNHAGGTLGGISTGMPLICRVAFKPTSSIKKTQMTLNLQKESVEFTLPEGSRHDPCVALRAPPIVEAMGALTLADALLMQRVARCG